MIKRLIQKIKFLFQPEEPEEPKIKQEWDLEKILAEMKRISSGERFWE